VAGHGCVLCAAMNFTGEKLRCCCGALGDSRILGQGSGCWGWQCSQALCAAPAHCPCHFAVWQPHCPPPPPLLHLLLALPWVGVLWVWQDKVRGFVFRGKRTLDKEIRKIALYVALGHAPGLCSPLIPVPLSAGIQCSMSTAHLQPVKMIHMCAWWLCLCVCVCVCPV
jgi:hypothetical protein